MNKSYVYCVLASAIVIISSAVRPSRVDCPPIKLKNGRVRYRQGGRFVKFMCTTGYIIAGEKYSTCVQRKWDTQIPKCVRPTCSKVRQPNNGLIYPSHRGAVLNFFCKSEYILIGTNATYCDGKKWDSNLPVCIKNGTKPATSCTFESEDLCGWSHDVNHDFDWRRMNLQTPSGFIGTGPSFDHTKGADGEGYYMYTESSSRNQNDTARLISPLYDKTENNTCLEFYYHMFGNSTGQLRVYIKKASESWDLNPNNAIFWKSGEQGNQWFRSFHQLGIIDEEFQIIVEGVRGNSYLSDIAIDDISLTENCVVDDSTSTTTDYPMTVNDEIVLDSCLNRCGNEFSNTSESFSCDCDDSCFETNRCCLDYAALCILGSTDDFKTTEDTSTTELYEKTTKKNSIHTTLEIRQNKNTKITTNHTQPKKVTLKYTKPPIIYLNRPTTFAIIPKIFTTKKIFKPPTKKIIQKLTTVPPTTKKIIKTNEENDVAKGIQDSLPVSTKKQLQPITKQTTLFTIKTTEHQTITYEDIENELDVYLSKVGTVNQRITEPDLDINTAYYIEIVGASVTLILTIAAIIAGVRKYRTSCIRLRNMKSSSNGDSQSDVRYFANDEELDFTWAKPSD